MTVLNTTGQLAIVIVNWNKPSLTIETLASLAGAKLPSQTCVYVVDNGSNPVYAPPTNPYPFKLRVLRSPTNLGFAGGNNLALTHLLGTATDYILLLNNDVTIDADCVDQLIQAAQHTPNALLSPLIYFAPGFEFHKPRNGKLLGKIIWYAGGIIDWQNIYSSHYLVNRPKPPKLPSRIPTDFASGCCMLMTMRTLKTIGLFDEAYYLYWEDADLATKAKRLGIPSLVVTAAVLWHKNSGSSKVGGDLHAYFLTRNRLLFGLRYASVHTKLALLYHTLLQYPKLTSWQKRGVVDYFLKKWGRGSWPSEK